MGTVTGTKQSLIWAASVGVAFFVIASGFVFYALQVEVEQPEDWLFKAAPETKPKPIGTFNLSVLPSQAQIDQPLRIRVSGVIPGEQVLLRASTTDADGFTFEGWATFIADSRGDVDLNEQNPQSGSYLSVDPMGLFWSMEEQTRRRFKHSEEWVSREYVISAETSEEMVSSTVSRGYPAKNLQLVQVDTEYVEAELWTNPTIQNQPIIIRLPGSDGRYSRLKSSLLSSYGFAVLDLRYHRGNSRGMPPSNLIPVERVDHAIDWLEKNQAKYGINLEQLGLFGTSKGAELGLLAGGYDHRIKVMFLWAPASMVFEGGTLSNPKGGSSWTWGSQPLPYAAFRHPYFDGAVAASRLTMGKAFSFLPTYQDAINDAAATALIPVEGLQSSVMLMGGKDDRMWPSSDMGRNISKRIFAQKKCVVDKFYADVGHRMNYELWPRGGKADLFVMGGRRDASYLAGADAWRSLVGFFKKTLIMNEALCI